VTVRIARSDCFGLEGGKEANRSACRWSIPESRHEKYQTIRIVFGKEPFDDGAGVPSPQFIVERLD